MAVSGNRRSEQSLLISVASPAYNEEECIADVVKTWHDTAQRLGLRAEFVVCNDGSTDATGKILDELAESIPGLRPVHSDKNGGYGRAMANAIAACQGDYIVTIDSDGQFDLAAIEEFLPLLDEDGAGVTGYRTKKRDSLPRVLADRALNLLVRLVFGTRLRDTNCAMKMVRRDLLQGMRPEARGYPFPTEIVLRLEHQGVALKEAPVRHLERTAGASKLKVWRTGWHMFWFLVYLRLQFTLDRMKVLQSRAS